MDEIVRPIQPEEEIPVSITLNEEKLPSIRERPTSLTPSFKFKKLNRRMSERPKTLSTFEGILKGTKNKTPKNTKIKISRVRKVNIK